MSKVIKYPIPVVRALHKIGQDISAARKRRRITMAMLAERAGCTRVTLSNVEKGSPNVSMGHYATILFTLGMLDVLAEIAHSDEIGQMLEIANLPKRVRSRKTKTNNDGM